MAVGGIHLLNKHLACYYYITLIYPFTFLAVFSFFARDLNFMVKVPPI